MKATTTSHIKFQRLQRRLKRAPWQVVGILETLWLITAQSTPHGDIGRFSNEDIAVAMGYSEDEDELIAALIDTGWLDVSDEHRLVIHDWHDHCPKYIHGVVGRSKPKRPFASVRPNPGNSPTDPPDRSDRTPGFEQPIEPIGTTEPPVSGNLPSLVYSSQAKPIQETPLSPPKGKGGDPLRIPEGWSLPVAERAITAWREHKSGVRGTTIAAAMGFYRDATEFADAVQEFIGRGWSGPKPPADRPASSGATAARKPSKDVEDAEWRYQQTAKAFREANDRPHNDDAELEAWASQRSQPCAE